MKQILLWLSFSAAFTSVSAQQSVKLHPKYGAVKQNKALTTCNMQLADNGKTLSGLMRTTGTAFMTEDFSSGSSAGLPVGWTSSFAGAQGGNWKWSNTASSSPYTLGTLSSTTAVNGWMIYDADSIYNVYPTLNQESYLTSPNYSCVGHAGVFMQFQEHFGRWYDDCYVEVSNNNGTTWTSFPVYPNEAIGITGGFTGNPETATINISSVAGNQPAVKLRFHYNGTITAGYAGYSWLIDDVKLINGDPVDLKISNNGIMLKTDTTYTTFSAIPSSLIGAINPISTLTNWGIQANASAKESITLSKNGTVVSANTQTFNLPAGVADTSFSFPPVAVSTSGLYTILFKADTTADANKLDNADTASFAINDTLYARSGKYYDGTYSIHHAATANPADEFSQAVGLSFVIPAGKHVTVNGVSVAFSPTSTPGTTLVVNSYYLNTNNEWIFISTSNTKTLTAADISTPTNALYARFTLPTNMQLTGGTYAFVVNGKNIPSTASVSILATTSLLPPGYSYLLDVVDTSNNDGVNSITSSWQQYGDAPEIRLNITNTTGINNIPGIINISVYPNPAKESVDIPIIANKDIATLMMRITNTLGQVVYENNITNVRAAEKRVTTVNTSILSPGTYFYSVGNGTEVASGSFIVAH